jgi:hypothetical protein
MNQGSQAFLWSQHQNYNTFEQGNVSICKQQFKSVQESLQNAPAGSHQNSAYYATPETSF